MTQRMAPPETTQRMAPPETTLRPAPPEMTLRPAASAALHLAIALASTSACGAGAAGSAGTAGSRPTAAAADGPGAGESADDASAAAIAAIERAVNQENAPIHNCWAMGAADDFQLEGEVVLSVLLGPGDVAERIQVVRDTTGDAILVDCLKELWAAHRWPAGVFAAGDTVQLPPFRFGAPSGQNVVSAAHVAKRPLGSEGAATASTAQVLIHPVNSGNGAAALILLEMAPAMKVARHRHAAAELLLVVSGSGRVRDRRVQAGDGLYIPAGAPHELETDGNQPLVAVQLHAPAGPEKLLLGRSDPGTQPVAAGERGASPGVRVASLARARVYPILDGKGKAQILLDPASTRDDAASLTALTIEPGAELPLHVHDGSSEFLILLEGRGVVLVEGEEIRVEAGDAVQVPSGIEHAFRAGDGGPVKVVQFHAPAGPEQRYKGGRP